MAGVLKEKRHNLSRSRIYNIWKRMRQRCNLKTCPAYASYGAKGIKVCEEWDNTETGFVNFYNWSIDNGYSDELYQSGRGKKSIDRIDRTKGYSPNNCRSATAQEQSFNTSRNHFITVNGKTKTIYEWIRTIPISRSFIYNRIRSGMSEEEDAVKAAIEYRNKNINKTCNEKYVEVK